MRLALYSAATGAEDHVGLPDQRQFTPLFPSYRSTLANLLGLRFIVTGAPIETIDPELKPGDLPLVARTSDGFIYENVDAFPRVLFATEARGADFARMLADGVWPAADLRSTVLLGAPARGRPRPAVPAACASSATATPRSILEADSPDGGWVVLNDLWHPWWFAEIDGQPGPDPARQRPLPRRRRAAGAARGALCLQADCRRMGAVRRAMMKSISSARP